MIDPDNLQVATIVVLIVMIVLVIMDILVLVIRFYNHGDRDDDENQWFSTKFLQKKTTLRLLWMVAQTRSSELSTRMSRRSQSPPPPPPSSSSPPSSPFNIQVNRPGSEAGRPGTMEAALRTPRTARTARPVSATSGR